MLPTLLEVEDEDCKMLSVEEKWKLVFKEDVGPPMYRPEEYSVHMQRWLSEGVATYHENNEMDDTCDDQTTGDTNDNLYLKELSNISDLLRNLKIDLKLAHTSFHAEFLGEPHGGVHLLLSTLKTLQGLQNSKPGPKLTARDVMLVQKRAVSDEFECLIGLKHATQCQDAMKILIDHASGLYLIAVSCVGTFTKSRIVALQLLTQACSMLNGHDAVTKAFSAVRLTMGEPVRFKLLVGMLNSPGIKSLLFQVTCLHFFNTLLETAHNVCERVYLQCEMEEAGLEVKILEKLAEMKESEHYDQYMDTLKQWKKHYVDVENLVYLSKRLASDNTYLRTEVDVLKKNTKKLEEDKINLLVVERELTEQCMQLEKKISSLRRNIDEREAHLQFARRQQPQQSTEEEGIGRSSRCSPGSAVNLNQLPQPGGGRPSQSNSPEAMSISSEEALRISSGEGPEPDNGVGADLIVPHIQRRPRGYVWANTEDGSIEVRDHVRNTPARSHTPAQPQSLPLHLKNEIYLHRHSNSDYASLGTDKDEDEWQLGWQYPDIPQPIAIVTPGKSCLQDMMHNNQGLRHHSQHLQHDSVPPRMLSVEFHKALFQRTYPVPVGQKMTKPCQV